MIIQERTARRKTKTVSFRGQRGNAIIPAPNTHTSTIPVILVTGTGLNTKIKGPQNALISIPAFGIQTSFSLESLRRCGSQCRKRTNAIAQSTFTTNQHRRITRDFGGFFGGPNMPRFYFISRGLVNSARDRTGTRGECAWGLGTWAFIVPRDAAFLLA
jgi:hypothetical protein